MKNRILFIFLSLVFLLATGCKDTTSDSQSRVAIDKRVPINSSTSFTSSAADSDFNSQTSIVSSQNSGSSSHSGSSSNNKTPSSQTMTSSNTSSIKNDYKVIKSFSPNKSATSGTLQYETPDLNLAAKGRGLIALKIKNTSHATKMTVYFTTQADDKYTTIKSIDLNIDFQNNTSQTYYVDLSELYGFTGKLKKLKIVSSVIFDGTLTLEKVELLEHGKLVPPFSITDKKIIATRKQLKEMTPSGISFFPDGIMGVLKNKDGSLNFFSSAPTSPLNTVASFRGSVDNPVKTFLFDGGSVIGTPAGYGYNQFNYVSIGQIYQFSENECFSILHLERHFDSTGSWDPNGIRSKKNNQYFVASFALGYSPDLGRTWYYAGEIATHACESEHPYWGIGEKAISNKSYSRDIGNGPFIIKDGYVYVYYIDTNKDYSIGIAVMRASLNDVISKARAKGSQKNTTLFKKFYNGSFSQPAFGGKYTSVIDDKCPANFMTIIYSTYLKKYVMVRTSAPAYVTNDGDIVMNISQDPTDFKGNNYYIDTDRDGQQYPSLIGIGDDPGFTTGKSVYLYYINAVTDDRFLWDKADLVQRIITFD